MQAFRLFFVFTLFFNLLSSQCYGYLKCPFCAFDNEDGELFCEQCKSDLSSVPQQPTPELQTADPVFHAPANLVPGGGSEGMEPPSVPQRN